MKTSSFGVKVVGYMGDAGYMDEEYVPSSGELET